MESLAQNRDSVRCHVPTTSAARYRGRQNWGRWAGDTIDGVEEREVQALVGQVEQAWNTHDMARFGACFTDDADFVNVRGWWWRGRPEIERNHALFHETIFSDSRITLELAAFSGLVPGVAVAHVRWRLVGHE